MLLNSLLDSAMKSQSMIDEANEKQQGGANAEWVELTDIQDGSGSDELVEQTAVSNNEYEEKGSIKLYKRYNKLDNGLHTGNGKLV